MKKVLFLMVTVLALGLLFAGCIGDITNITAPGVTETEGVATLSRAVNTDPDFSEYADDEDTYVLYAGQEIEVGTVTVWNDESTLYVKYYVDSPWCLTETHVHVGESLPDFPLNKGGNPKVGLFDYSKNHDCVGSYTYRIPLGEWENVLIAAHAVVQKTTVITEAPYYASGVVDYYQGFRKDGAPVLFARSAPKQGLVFETGKHEENFFSLGFGGWIIVEFDCPIQNGEGDDIRIIEDTWGGGYPLETADVYASKDGSTNWVHLGEADNRDLNVIHTVSKFDLGILSWAKYIKVVDTSDPTLHNNTADGYDLNAVESLQDCVKIVEETAWADGTRFVEPGNWATYFDYTVKGWGGFDNFDVPADTGIPTLSHKTLDSEGLYKIEAVGTYNFRLEGNSSGYLADAEYAKRSDSYGEGWTAGDESPYSEPYNGLDLCDADNVLLNIDWGELDEEEHTYSIYYLGEGSELKMFIKDSDYDDNSGSLTVNIYKWE